MYTLQGYISAGVNILADRSDIEKFHDDFLNTFYGNTTISMLNNFKKQNPHLSDAEYEELRTNIEKDLRAGKTDIKLKF